MNVSCKMKNKLHPLNALHTYLFFLFILSTSLFSLAAAQQLKSDSLYSVWLDQNQPDSIRAKSLASFIKREYLFTNPDSARILAEELLSFGQEQGYPRAEAMSYDMMAISRFLVGDYQVSLDYFKRCLALFRALGDERSEANALGNIGNIYSAQGLYSKALDNYLGNLKIFESLDDKNSTAVTLGNIGVLYETLQDFDKALEYYERSYTMGKLVGKKRIVANNLGNMGNIYLERGEFEIALDKYQESLTLNREADNVPGVINTLGNVSTVYTEQGEFEKALSYLKQGIEASMELGDKRGLAQADIKMGTIYQLQNNHQQAIKSCLEAYRLANEIGILLQQKKACQCLYTSYKQTRNTAKALEYFEQLKTIEDSLQQEDTSKKLQQMEFKKALLTDSIAKAEEARIIKEAHQKEVLQKNQTRNILAAVGTMILILALGIYSRLRYIRKSKAIIEEAHERSENLLLNILPADIAAELKEKGKADARDFDEVSILFTDFKGFTEQSAKMSAADLVNEINICFEAFDGIMANYGVEKIKTIGDAYMAAGGLPVQTADSVKNTVLAALEMQDFIVARGKEQGASGLPFFEMRVGIHTGPVVAGIVGVKKFQYDIWGDTVNTASRMESAGEVGKVNISEATYELLRDDTEFAFENRGKIEVKGKGEMEMYFVSRI